MNRELIFKNENEVKFFTSDSLNNIKNVRHFFSTRIGGISEGYYSNMNLGIYTSDRRENVDDNFKKIIKCAGMSMDKLVYLKQVHGDNFYVVDENNYSNIIGSEGDALITRTKGITIGVFTADCVPIILVDSKKDIIAVIHAGWKGTKLRIVEKILNYLINTLGARPQDIFAAIGPSIGHCCFEVQWDVAKNFKHKLQSYNNWYVDLGQENIDQIINYGIPIEAIEGGNICTMCDKELFFSYRRDNGYTGRLGTFIQLI